MSIYLAVVFDFLGCIAVQSVRYGLLSSMFHGLCLLDTAVSPIKTAEAIEMLFGVWTRVGPRNHVLHGCLHPQAGAILGDMFWATEKYSK